MFHTKPVWACQSRAIWCLAFTVLLSRTFAADEIGKIEVSVAVLGTLLIRL